MTYDEFIGMAQASGMLGQFSGADLELARKYPDFGASLLNLKKKYAAASSDDERNAANTQANALRMTYGSYTAGEDGMGYSSAGLSPVSYASSGYNQLGDTVSEQLTRLKNYGAFSYNQNQDPSFGAYRKEYRREGSRATADALGQAAASSGGIPSTYAATAASQAGDYYAGKLADAVPTLYQQAYERYLNRYNMLSNTLNQYQEQDKTNYGRYLDTVDFSDQQKEAARQKELDKTLGSAT